MTIPDDQSLSDKAGQHKIGCEYTAKVERIVIDYLEQIDLIRRHQERLLRHLAEQDFFSIVLRDVLSFSKRDPALWQRFDIILGTQSLRTLILHRIAHDLLSSSITGIPDNVRENSAFALAQLNRLANGVDIHPNAVIGQRTIFDHVFGLVVGETAVIGNDCYILGGVTLGAYGIADNPRGCRRHPIIGNNVQIGAYARVLGPVHVGDNSFISPHAVITKDVCSNAHVSIVNQLQQTKLQWPIGQKIRVFGVKVECKELVVFCDSKGWIKPDFVDDKFETIPALKLCRKCKGPDYQRFEINETQEFHHLNRRPIHLRITTKTFETHMMHINTKVHF